MGDGNYIGYTGASSTVVSVVADIAESLDISGFSPSIAVSSIPALAVSSIVLDAPIAVSGTILDTIAANVLTTSSIVGSVAITNTPTVAISAFPANQNVSGTSLDAIETATEGVLADTDLMVSDLDAIRIDAAAMEDLLTLMRVDLGNVSGVDVSGIGATNALLATIDADTGAILADTALMVPDLDAIRVDTAANEVLLTGIDTVLDNILTKNTEIDTALDTIDGVLDSSLTKQTEIDAVLDTIKTDTGTIDAVLDASKLVQDNILTKNTEIDTALDTIDAVLDNILTKNTEIDAVLDTIKVDTEAIETATEAIAVDAAAMETLLTNTNAGLTSIDAVLDTIKVDTEAIETATEAIQVDTAANEVLLTSIKTAVETIDNAVDGNYLNVNANIAGTDFVGGAGAATAGTLRTTLATDDSSLGLLTAIQAGVEADTTVNGTVTSLVAFPAITSVIGGGVESGAQRVTIANDSTGSVGIKPSTSSYLSHVYIDLDAAGDNPTTNTEVVAAPGASSKLVIYGVQGSIAGSTGSAYGNWYLSDGNTAAATTLWTARAQGTTNTQFELTFPYGVALTTNTALKVTSSEGSGNIFINAVVYYRTEAV
jgi:hypothetical protein